MVRSPARAKAEPPRAAAVSVKAFAKINLTLRVLGVREDGYHELRTTFQSLALHDTLTFTAARGPFHIACDDDACPAGHVNLVWQAAEELWRAAGRRGEPNGVRARLEKRIPLAAGLGGGSSDAAASLRGLASLWRTEISDDRLRGIAARLGADVPFFLEGGTALGVGRGDVVLPLIDRPSSWVVLLLPDFGVSTADAYGWLDRQRGQSPLAPGRDDERANRSGLGPGSDAGNDLEAPVVERHPEIGLLVGALRESGAAYAAMSGSGSAVFGLFGDRKSAENAAGRLKDATRRVLVTRTLRRAEHARLASARATGRDTK